MKNITIGDYVSYKSKVWAIMEVHRTGQGFMFVLLSTDGRRREERAMEVDCEVVRVSEGLLKGCGFHRDDCRADSSRYSLLSANIRVRVTIERSNIWINSDQRPEAYSRIIETAPDLQREFFLLTGKRLRLESKD
ncbi:MAG: hypothetical protein ACRCZM_11845 [Bacteroidales bacterium]